MELNSSKITAVPQATHFLSVDVSLEDYDPGHLFWIVSMGSGDLKALGGNMKDGEEGYYPLQEGENSIAFRKVFADASNAITEFTVVW